MYTFLNLAGRAGFYLAKPLIFGSPSPGQVPRLSPLSYGQIESVKIRTTSGLLLCIQILGLTISSVCLTQTS